MPQVLLLLRAWLVIKQDQMVAVSMVIEKTGGFVVSTTEFVGEPAPLVHHRMLYNHPPLGPSLGLGSL